MQQKKILLLLFLSVSFFSMAQSLNKNYLDYIEKYHELAIIQQKEHGIPASITLAQGLLESGAGKSELALKSNNHFGIKCHDWTGAKTYHDDDKSSECFRKYKQVLDSYEDHSSFLKTRPRYAFLFDLSPTDYKGWAYGLKKAGYATDPAYPQKLIRLIEDYDLHQYDLNSRTKKTKTATAMSINSYSKHTVYKNNGVNFVVAKNDDTYGIIASEFGIKEKKTRKFNEVNAFAQLLPGEHVYLRPKKNKAARGNTVHVVRQGESMLMIADTYAIKLEKLYEINSMPYTQGARVGQVLKLR